MLNVRDECDLPEDDGYDLFTRETEFERHRKEHPQSRTSCRDDCWGRSSFPVRPNRKAATYGAK